MGPDGGFITGSDFLMDGGVTAAYWYGDVAEVRGSVSAPVSVGVRPCVCAQVMRRIVIGL
jgi:hypothetical protein